MNDPRFLLSQWRVLLVLAVLLTILNLLTGQKLPDFNQPQQTPSSEQKN